MLSLFTWFSLGRLFICSAVDKPFQNRTELVWYSLSSKGGKQCPKTMDKVFVWEPPVLENFTLKCLEKAEKPSVDNPPVTMEKVLREAFRPVQSDTPPIRVFHHVVIDASTYLTSKRGDPVFETQLQKMLESGLLDEAFILIRVGILNTKENPKRTECIKEVFESRVDELTSRVAGQVVVEYFDPLNFECDSILRMKHWCSQNKEALILYLHNKGKSRESSTQYPFVVDWREYMIFFVVERWRWCVNSLMQGMKGCGVNKQMNDEGIMHYSGNF